MSIGETSTRSNPEVGEIRTVRISMATLFMSESSFDSFTSNESKSSSSEPRDRPKNHPCVIWRTTPDLQVLVMSRFDDADVSDPNVRLFNHLSVKNVLKMLVAVYPKAPYGGRRSIAAATRSSINPIKTINTNLILIPVSIEEQRHWTVAAVEYFPAHELEYIVELIFQLAAEERVEQLKIIKQLNPPPLIDEKEAIEQEDNTSSSSSSSIPKRRSELIHIEWRKDDFINTWLNDGFPKITDHEKSSENHMKLPLDHSSDSPYASI